MTRGIGESSSLVRERTLSCLLVEMDGITQNKSFGEKTDIIVIGVTQNRDCLDPAILRPGRLDLHIYFPLPDKNGRLEILKKALAKTPITDDISLDDISERTENFTGADLQNVCQEAVMICLRENIKNDYVKKEHFERALELCGSKSLGDNKNIKQQQTTKDKPLFDFSNLKNSSPLFQFNTKEKEENK